MTDLTIDRFTSTVQVPDGDGETQHAGATARRPRRRHSSGARHRESGLPPGRLVRAAGFGPARAGPGSPATALEEQWAQP